MGLPFLITFSVFFLFGHFFLFPFWDLSPLLPVIILVPKAPFLKFVEEIPVRNETSSYFFRLSD